MESIEQDTINLIRLAMAMEVNKRPLRRDDIIARILGGNSRNLRSVLVAANERLARDFSMQLVPLTSTTRQLSTVTVAGRKKANLNVIPSAGDERRQVNQSKEGQSFALVSIVENRHSSLTAHPMTKELTVLCIILAILSVSGGEIEEKPLMQRLNEILDSSYSTSLKAPLDELLTQWKRQKYLTSYRRPEEDGMHVTMWMAGPRANVEFPLEAIALFIEGLGRLSGSQDLPMLRKRVAFALKAPEKDPPDITVNETSTLPSWTNR